LRRHHYFLIGLILCLALLSVPRARAQYNTKLTPNETLSSQHIWSNQNGYYYANLDAGSWTVIVKSDGFWGMSLAVAVRDADTAEVMAATEGSGGASVSLEFTLEENTIVNILVEETGSGSGFYSIGVYNGLNAVAATYGVWLIIVPVLVFVSIGVIVYRAKSGGKTADDQELQVEAPEFAVPERYRHRGETKDIRTMRLPAKCPSCGASLSQKDIDWVGPLEAECNYCGAIVKARLERL